MPLWRAGTPWWLWLWLCWLTNLVILYISCHKVGGTFWNHPVCVSICMHVGAVSGRCLVNRSNFCNLTCYDVVLHLELSVNLNSKNWSVLPLTCCLLTLTTLTTSLFTWQWAKKARFCGSSSTSTFFLFFYQSSDQFQLHKAASSSTAFCKSCLRLTSCPFTDVRIML